MNLVFGIPLRPEVGNLGKNNFGKRFGVHIWSAGIKKFCSGKISFTALLRQQQKIHSTLLLIFYIQTFNRRK